MTRRDSQWSITDTSTLRRSIFEFGLTSLCVRTLSVTELGGVAPGSPIHFVVSKWFIVND